MKIGLVSMMGNVGSTLNSQGGGYGLIATRMITDNHPHDYVEVNPAPSEWGTFDKLYVCEGVNFVEGSFNVPGGPQPLHIEKMTAMGNYKGQIAFVNQRFDFSGFNKRLKIEGLDFPDGPVHRTFLEHSSQRCVIGDSHALSVWRPSWSLDFTAGRTLHGFLKRANADEINSKYEKVILYFGNIDLRFHLMRQPNPESATRDLFNRYIEFCLKLKDATVVGLLPVEHESRKLPGTGLYKGEKFFGTREERMRLREIANSIMQDTYGVNFLDWPKDWVDADGTKMLDILEMKQSVHIKPKHYMFGSLFIN
jgi:hypothetical protein